jgi:uncharacterized C2H2 Zn-finger protein
MKFLFTRACPCCNKTIMYNNFLEYKQSMSGDGELKLFECPFCNHYILSIKEYTKWSERIHLLMTYIFVIAIFFIDYFNSFVYYVFFVIVSLWIILEKVIPFKYMKLMCYDKKESQRLKYESSFSIGMGILIILLFIGIIYGLFNILIQEHEYQKDNKNKFSIRR